MNYCEFANGLPEDTDNPNRHYHAHEYGFPSEGDNELFGRLLLEKMIRYTQSRGSTYLISETMRENVAMQTLARKVGMAVEDSPEDPQAVRLILKLN